MKINYLKVGITLGVVLGSLLLILSNYIEHKFNSFWNEVCFRNKCSYYPGDISINYFTGKFTAKNINFINKESKVIIPEMNLYYEYLPLFKKEFKVSKIDFIGSEINGFLQSSVIFKVIRDLIEPKEDDNYFDFIIKEINIKDSIISNKFGNTDLVGKKFNFKCKNDEIIKYFTNINKLEIQLNNDKYELGSLFGNYIDDSLEVALKGGFLDLNSKIKLKDKLVGNIFFDILTAKLNNNINTKISSTGIISGEISNPLIDLKSINKTPIRVFDKYEIESSELKTRFNLDGFSIDSFKIVDYDFQGLDISSDYNKIKADTDFYLDSIEYGSLKINNPRINLKISGELSEPEIILGLYGDSYYGAINIPDSKLEYNSKNNSLNFDSNQLKANYDFKKLDFKIENLTIGNNIVSGKDIIKLDNFKTKLLFNDKVINITRDNDELSFKLNSGNLNGTLKINDQINLLLDFKDLDFKSYFNTEFCSNFTGNLKYSSSIENSLNGNGYLKINNSTFGCQNKFELADQNHKIQNGEINLNNQIIKNEKNLKIIGKVSLDNSNLEITGSSQINKFNFINQNLNNFSGDIKLNCNITDNIFTPKISGLAQIDNLSGSYDKFFLKDGNGIIEFDENKFSYNINTKLNYGSASFKGNLNEHKIDFKEINFELDRDTKFQLSGNLKYDSFEIIGDVVIDSGRITRNFNFKDLISKFIKSDKSTSKKDLSIPINIFLTSNNDLLFISNYFSSELAGSLNITGTTNQLVFDGRLKLNNGWLGISDRKMNITSGDLVFTRHISEPKIDLFAETTLITHLGYPVNVEMNLTGDLTNPKLKFFSDLNYSEQEILQLLSASGTPISTAGNIGEINLFSRIPYSDLLGKLSKIDSLSVEPGINPRTGLSEPSLLAEKKLMDDVSLFGQSFISQNFADNRLFLDYPLTDRLTLSTVLDNDTSQQKVAFGVDLKYEFFKSIPKIIINGETELSKFEIRKVLGFKNQYYLNELNKYKINIRNYLAEQGYEDSEINIKCLNECKIIIFSIKDGNLLKFKFENDKLLEKYNGLIASSENIDRIRSEILKQLRIAGYINASMFLNSKSDYRIDYGDKFLLEFYGNSFFSVEELLENYGFYSGTNSISNNFLSDFVDKTNLFYKNSGFYNIKIDTEIVPHKDYTQIKFFIKEGEQPDVEDIKFNIDDFYEIISNNQNLISEIKNLNYIIDSKLVDISSKINNYLIEIGFSNNNINYRVDNNIVYFDVELGEKIVGDWIDIEDSFEKPTAPYSVFQANKFLDQVIDKLKDDGYLNPSYSSEIVNDKLRIFVEYGKRVKLRKLYISGISEELANKISNKIDLKEDTFITRDLLNRTKSKILNLGMFSKIEVKPLDGQVDQEVEDYIISLEEKPDGNLKTALGVNSELGYHVFLEGRNHGIFKDGKAFFLTSNTYFNSSGITEGTAGIRYSDPDFSDYFPRLNIDTRFQRLNQPTLAYDLDRQVVDLLLINSKSKLKFNLGSSIYHDKIDSDDLELISDSFTEFNLAALNFNISYDNRDNSLNPTKGYQFGIDLKYANKNFISDLDFFETVFRASWIKPLSYSRFLLANNSRVGYIDSENLPASLRFFLGGRSSVRGYRENGLGNKTSLDNSFGGDKLISNNLELQYKLTQSFNTHIFLDSGYLSYNDLSTSFRHSYGVGLSFNSVVGNIGTDIGFPIAKEENEDSWRLHFSLGSMF